MRILKVLTALALVTSTTVATEILFSEATLANPPRVQGPTRNGETLDVVQARANQKANFVKKHGVTEQELEQQAKPRKQRGRTGSIKPQRGCCKKHNAFYPWLQSDPLNRRSRIN